MMKKRIALFMACLLAFNLVYPFITDKTKVLAASNTGGNVTLNAFFNKTLVTGTQSYVPNDSSDKSCTADQVFIEWDLLADNATYTLSYYIRDNFRIDFTVKKESSGIITAEYKPYYKGSANPMPPLKNSKGELGYSIYSSDVSGYVLAKDYPNQNSEYTINNLDNIETTSPSFDLTPGVGFSIKYNFQDAPYEQYLHFLWNNNGKFQFVTNGVQAGKIYDINLTVDPVGVSDVYYLNEKVIAGIDGFKMTPIANGDKTEENLYVFNSSIDVLQDNRSSYFITPGAVEIDGAQVNTAPLDLSTAAAKKEDKNYPARTDGNGIIYTFDLPKAVDALGVFSETPDNLLIDAEISLRHSDSSKNYRIELPDIFRSKKTPYIATEVKIYSADSAVKSLFYRRIEGSNKIQVWLTGFDSGMLFTETTITLTSPASDTDNATKYLFKSTLLNGYSYTFLEYETYVTGSNYFIRFKPYQGYKGTYYLYTQSGLNPNTDLKYSDEELDPEVEKNCVDYTQDMIFPLGLETTSGLINIYHLKFQPQGSSSKIYTQRIRFGADPNDIALGLPDNFSRLSHILTPKKPGKYDEGVLNLSLTWNIAKHSDLEKLIAKYAPINGEITIDYDLYSTLSPTDVNTKPDNYADVALTIKWDSSKNAFVYKSKVTYNDYNTTVADDNWQELKYEAIGNNRTYYAIQNLTLNAWREGSGGDAPNYINFFYPNVYFLNLGVSGIKGDGKDYPYSIGTTSFVSMPLDPINESEMPPPQNINVTPGATSTDASGALQFSLSSSKMRDYINNTFTAVSGSAVNIDVSFNMYISTDESDLKNLYSLEEGTNINSSQKRRDDRLKASLSAEYTSVPNAELPYSLNFSSLKVSETGDYKDKSLLSAVRDGEMIMIPGMYEYHYVDPEDGKNLFGTDLPDLLRFTLEGLDKNQKYYVAVDFQFARSSNYSDPILVERTSTLSSIAAFTTAADEVAAGEDEKQPSSPELTLLNKKNILMNQATIWWTEIAGSLSNDANVTEKIEYEIVRSQSPVDEKHLQIVDDISYFWKEVKDEKKGYRTDGKQVYAYDPSSTNGHFNNLATDYDKDAFKRELGVIDFPNTGLDPNKVYFYYVRTVRTVQTGTTTTVKYSSWSQISVTTTPVQAPENLVIDRSNRDAYDSKTETILRFDVPVPDPVAIQYIMKADNGEWSNHIPVTASSITWTSSTIAGYLSGSFKIIGLKPNTGYSFMVRVIDDNGDVSMYSNSASTRTDNDQSDYDNQKEQDDWSEFLNNELANLIKQYYWLADDTTSAFTAIYRPSMFDTLLNQSIDSQITLTGSDKNASSLTYYIPASGLLSANAANKGFVINSDNMQIVLPKNSFDPNTNTAIQDMVKQINNKTLSDYMIKISVTLSAISSVDGSEPASKQARVSFELAGLSVSNTDFDKTVVSLITNKINSDATLGSIKTELTRMIKNNASNEQLSKYIESAVAKVFSQITGDVSTQLTKATSKRTTLLTLNAPMILSCKSDDSSASVKGYASLNNAWVGQEVSIMGDRVAMTVTTPGLYVFAKSVLNLIGLETIAGANNIKAVIIKYGLDDFLGKGTSFDINSPATANMVAGIVSRICGAPKGTDPLTYLKNNGVTVSARNQYSSISNQESIYLMMYLYEKKTNTKISTMTIRNFAATSGINGIDEKYKKSIQAAFEVGVYTDKNMKPAANATTKDVLTMLGNLNSKLKF